jgi:hypothetical protein
VRKRERPTLSTKPLLMSFDDGGLIPVTPERLEKSDKKSGKIVQRKSCSNPTSPTERDLCDFGGV